MDSGEWLKFFLVYIGPYLAAALLIGLILFLLGPDKGRK
jgi:hypothetical protein